MKDKQKKLSNTAGTHARTNTFDNRAGHPEIQSDAVTNPERKVLTNKRNIAVN